MPPIIFFDGVCNFCNFWVNFILKRDKKRYFRFAPLQGETAAKMLAGISKDKYDSVILFENEKQYTGSTAVLRISRKLDGGWKLIYALIIIPGIIRDPLYKLIANNRYKLFGKKDACMVPSADVKDRFLP